MRDVTHHPGTGQAGRRGRITVWITRAVLGALLVASLVLGGTAFRVWQVAFVEQRHSADMIVVLGAAQYNGDPSPVLRSRLEHALELYRSGLSEHIVTVGGNQAGDNYTEAQASSMWLVEQGVPPGAVVEAEVGSDTLRSIRAVSGIAERRDWDSALIVSDPWHSWRCRIMAEDQGLRAMVSPTRSGPTEDVRSAYILREAAATLFYRVMHASADVTGYGLG
ncbi:YdcF family protein [Actinopolyspora sp. H202]|uniref:YdcF family protein n=1 Tax=Actinopolyspora sp. H202 TaxID=1500456 RepID=UPI003EE6FAAB